MLDGQQRPSTAPVRYRGVTDIAIELHETVHPARWCITFADLKFFRSEVHKAIQDGQNFQENFSEYGPSIYAVNEHYIKPVTAAAGKMSWALMMNPHGLDCDLFITHAWQEDVFEFTDKVLTSWPWRARHAWCCMLANPQNLDIGALLQSPSMSPFALACRAPSTCWWCLTGTRVSTQGCGVAMKPTWPFKVTRSFGRLRLPFGEKFCFHGSGCFLRC